MYPVHGGLKIFHHLTLPRSITLTHNLKYANLLIDLEPVPIKKGFYASNHQRCS